MKQHYLVRWDEDENGKRKYVYSKDKRFKNTDKRYGWRVKCTKCKWRTSSGGIKGLELANLAFLQTEKYHSSSCDGQLLVRKDYHATEIGHKFVEQTTRQTRTANTYADIPGAVILDADLTDGDKYLLVCTAQFDCDSNARDSYIRAVHNSTEFEGSEIGKEPAVANPNKMQYFWFTVWTAVASEDVKLQFRAEDNARTVGADQITMVAINLSDLTENTDWHFDEDTTDTTLAASYATGNSASITFTPNGSDDWLVLANAQIDPATASVPQKTRINASGGVTDTGVEWIEEAEHAVKDQLCQTLAKVYTPSNSSTTFATNSESSSATGKRVYNSIFALNLNKFDVHDQQVTQAEINLDTTDAFATSTNVATISITPSAADTKVWCLGFFIRDNNALTGNIKARMQVDSADQPGTQTSDFYPILVAWDSTDELPWCIQTIENLDNTSHTTDVDATNASSNRPVEDRLAMMVTMELAAAGGSFEVTATTVLTHSSVNPVIKGANRTPAQTLTHSEAIAQQGVFSRTASTVLTHSSSNPVIKGASRTATTVLTHVDSVALIKGFARTIAQTITHSESIAKITEAKRTATTILTHSDSVALVKGFLRTVAQTITHSESITRSTGSAVTATTVLVHSSVNPVIKAASRTVAQILTHSESIARIFERAVTASQILTHVDSAVSAFGKSVTAVQTITHSDSVVILREYLRSFAQNLTHSESIATETARSVTATTILTESDSVVVEKGAGVFEVTATQILTHIDSVVRLYEALRTATTVLTHSEVIAKTKGLFVTAAQTLTHSEVITQFATLTRAVAQLLTHLQSVVVEGGTLAPVGKRRPQTPAPPLQPLAPEVIEERLTIILQISLFKKEIASQQIATQTQVSLYQRESITTRLLDPERWLVKDYIISKIKLVLTKKERYSTKIYIKLRSHIQPKLLKQDADIEQLVRDNEELREYVQTLQTSLEKLAKNTMSAEDVLGLFSASD